MTRVETGVNRFVRGVTGWRVTRRARQKHAKRGGATSYHNVTARPRNAESR